MILLSSVALNSSDPPQQFTCILHTCRHKQLISDQIYHLLLTDSVNTVSLLEGQPYSSGTDDKRRLFVQRDEPEKVEDRKGQPGLLIPHQQIEVEPQKKKRVDETPLSAAR